MHLQEDNRGMNQQMMERRHMAESRLHRSSKGISLYSNGRNPQRRTRTSSCPYLPHKPEDFGLSFGFGWDVRLGLGRAEGGGEIGELAFGVGVLGGFVPVIRGGGVVGSFDGGGG